MNVSCMILPLTTPAIGSRGYTSETQAARADAKAQAAAEKEAKRLYIEAREAEVRATGSGDVEVSAAERLAVRLDGSGDVTYAGDPAVTRELDGSGDLHHAG